VSAIHSLQILLGIPITIEKYNRISRREVNPQPASTRAEQKEATCGVGVEGRDLGAAGGLRDGAVDAADGPVAEVAGVGLEEVELGGELREDEDFVRGGEEGGEEAVEEQHFAGFADQAGVGGRGGWPGPVEVVGAVAGQAQLHDWVLELFGGDLFSWGEGSVEVCV